MQKKLTLFTADYPFGTGETFLETEITYLAEGFDEVVIVSQNLVDAQTRQVPANCKLVRLNLSVSIADKLLSLTGLLHPIFWKEIHIVKKVYAKSLSKGILSTMLISLFRAKKVKSLIAKQLKNRPAETQNYFYSYWCDDVALALALAQKRKSEISCFCRMHGWDVYFEASTINYLPYRHFITENLKAIFAISKKGKDYAVDQWKIPNLEKVIVSRLGVHEQSIEKYNSTEFILVSCSNVIPLKRVDLIVRSLAELKDVPLKWVHFGDGPELEKVKILALNLLPEKIVADFKGRVGNKEILEWYAENNPNLFINVSTTEGIPVSIMEAMSFGIPVIATNVGGTSEIVNNENGILLLSNPSANEVSHAIELLMLDEKLLESKKEQAYNMWLENYNGRKNYKQFILDFQNL
jgi:glycosyltransferase involved in cell wall biosynthesis